MDAARIMLDEDSMWAVVAIADMDALRIVVGIDIWLAAQVGVVTVEAALIVGNMETR